MLYELFSHETKGRFYFFTFIATCIDNLCRLMMTFANSLDPGRLFATESKQLDTLIVFLNDVDMLILKKGQLTTTIARIMSQHTKNILAHFESN